MATQLAMIGAGAMGGAILEGAIDAGVLEGRSIVVIEPDDARRDAAARLGCATSAELRFAHDAREIMLCIKPQVFPGVASELGRLMKPTVITSIMAGLSSAVIRSALGSAARVVRAMPNTPCRVRAGITALAMGDGGQPGDDQLARAIFSALGEVVEVDESLMHAVTAVSGSGPAYIFLLAESMEQAGVQLGLDPHTARRLAYRTVFGAGRLLDDADAAVTGLDGGALSSSTASDGARHLRAAVTSPGGTTAAALGELFEAEFPQIIADAMLAARDRGMELDAEESLREP